VQVSVNLSPDLLLDPGIADRIEAKVIEHSVAHHNVIIEIPESVLAHDAREVMETLVQLRQDERLPARIGRFSAPIGWRPAAAH